MQYKVAKPYSLNNLMTAIVNNSEFNNYIYRIDDEIEFKNAVVILYGKLIAEGEYFISGVDSKIKHIFVSYDNHKNHEFSDDEIDNFNTLLNSQF